MVFCKSLLEPVGLCSCLGWEPASPSQTQLLRAPYDDPGLEPLQLRLHRPCLHCRHVHPEHSSPFLRVGNNGILNFTSTDIFFSF